MKFLTNKNIIYQKMPLLVPGVEHSFRPPRIKLIGKACFSGRSEKEETIFVNFNFSP